MLDRLANRLWTRLLLLLCIGLPSSLSAQANAPWVERTGRGWKTFGQAVPVPDSPDRWAVLPSADCRVTQFGRVWLTNVATAKWTGSCTGGYAEGSGKLTLGLKSGRSAIFVGKLQQGLFTEGAYTLTDSLHVEGEFRFGVLFKGTIRTADNRLQFDGTILNGAYAEGSLYFADGARYQGIMDWSLPRDSVYGLPASLGILLSRSGIEERWWVDGRPVASKEAYQSGLDALTRRNLAVRDSIIAAQKERSATQAAESRRLADSLERVAKQEKAAARGAAIKNIAGTILQGIQAAKAAGLIAPPQADVAATPDQSETSTSGCIELQEEQQLSGGFENRCEYAVNFSFCAIGAAPESPASYFNCTKSNGIGRMSAPALRRVTASTNGKNASTQIYTLECRAPASPYLVSFTTTSGLAGRCR